VERVEPRPPNQFWGRRHCQGGILVGNAEQESKGWADRSKVRFRPEGQVNLQSGVEEEYPEECRSVHDIEMVDGPMVSVHPIGPLRDHPWEIRFVSDLESEIDVRPSIFSTGGGGPRDGRSRDPAIRDSRRYQLLA
jgi:hypothetical protein